MLSSGYRPKTKRVYVSWTRLRLLSNKYIYVVNGCCIPCGGANLQQGPTTVKSDTGASVHSPASSPHTTPTPNQDDPSRHYTDVGNTLATVFPPQPGRQGGVGKTQKRFVPGCCIPCGGANLQQGPTTVKSDTRASVQIPASSPHTTPTPNQDDPSRHCSDVGNTLATVFPPQPRHKVGWEKLRNGLYPVAASPVVVQTCSRDPLQSKVTQEHQCNHQHHPHTPLLLQIRTTPLGTANQRIRVMARHTFCMGL